MKSLVVLFLLALGTNSVFAQGVFDSSLFNSSNKDDLQLIRITPDGEDAPVSNRQIVFKFNQPVVAIGDMQREAKDIPISISPAIACQWLWLDTSSLACQLNQEDQLVEATRYSIRIEPNIHTTEGAGLKKAQTHSFITERPIVVGTYLEDWANAARPVMQLSFNQPVTQSSLERFLRLKPKGLPSISIVAVDEFNPLHEPIYQQEKQGDEFKQLPSLASYLDDEGKKLELDKKLAERKAAYATARTLWRVMPNRDLPDDVQIDLSLKAGLKSVYGDQLGIASPKVHTFKSLPKFSFLGVNCRSYVKQSAINIEPIYDSKTALRNADSGIALKHGVEECNPLDGVSLVFSTPVSYETARKHLKVSPDLSGGIKEYDPWATRNDRHQLQSFFDYRFNYGDNTPYHLNLPEILKAYEHYSLISDEGLVDVVGRSLKAPIDMGFLTSHRAPLLMYDHPFSVLEKDVQSELPIHVTNLDEIKVENYSVTTTDALQQGLTHERSLPEVEDVAYKIPLGVRELLNGRSGVVAGTINSTPEAENYYLGFRFFSQVTPFQVHLKFGHFNSLAWVTDMRTGLPVAGASVVIELDDYGSIEPLRKLGNAATTDKDGMVMLPGYSALDPKLEYAYAYEFEEPRFMLKVVKDEDMAVLPIDYEFQTRSNIWHRKKTQDSYLHAWGTTAQGVYKAGDTVQYKLYVRNQNGKHWIAPPQGGYALEVFDPKGQSVLKLSEVSLSKFGSFDGEFKTTKSAAVGWYDFVLTYRSAVKELTYQPMRVLISDFTPAAFRVSSELNGDQFQTGDQISVTSLAKMHAGGPYADAQARVTAVLNNKRFSSSHPSAKDFNFDDYSQNRTQQTIHQSTGNVGKQGELETTFEMQESSIKFGRLRVETAVRDDRGKYIASSASADYVGRDRFVGLKDTRWLHQAGKSAAFNTLVVDSRGQPVADTKVNIEINHYVTRAVRVKGAGNAYLTQYKSEWLKVADCNVKPSADIGKCEFIPEKPGSYQLIAKIIDSKGRENQTSLDAWVVGKGDVVWQAANNQRLDMTANAKDYQVGDVARLLVKNPYPGAQALISVERYGVLRQWRQKLKGSTPVIEVPIKEDDYPGVYVSVVVTSPRVAQPLGEGNVDLGKPAFKIGYQELKIRDNNKELDVAVKPDREVYKPRETVKVKLKAKPRTGQREPMEVAVVVIDEAVFDLNVNGRRYYDPYKGFNKLEPLGVGNYNTLLNLIGRQKFEKKGANPGGGGGGDETDLRNLLKFVAYWNPSIELDKRGKASFEFSLPDNLTGWRVFAMAVTKEDRMGLGETSFKVNRPTELRPVMPNQLTEGDQVQTGFSVMNRTDKPRTLKVELKAAGDALDQSVSRKLSVELDAYQRKTVWLPLKVDKAGELALFAKAGDALDADALEHHIAVNKRRALTTAATYGTSTQEQVLEKFAYPQSVFDDVGGIEVELSPSVIGNIKGAFEYLRDYPYACWEQQLSKGVAAAQFGRLKNYLPDDLTWADNEQAIINTLENAASFQAANGGFTYWVNNNDYVSPYLSAYTALSFVWLRDMGYSIPEGVEQRLHGYLQDYLRGDSSSTNQKYSAGVRSSIRAVALAALAAHGAIDHSDLERYAGQWPQMDLFGKAHFMQAASALNVDEQELVELSKSILSYSTQSGGKVQFNEEVLIGSETLLHTPVRSNCAILSSLLNASDKSSEVLQVIGDVPFKQVRAITQTRGSRAHWQNTQENLYCMNALLEYSRAYEKQNPNMAIDVALQTEQYGAQSIGNAKFSDVREPAQILSSSQDSVESGLSGEIAMNKTGQGRFYYAVRMSYAQTQDNASRVNAGFEIKREYSVQRDGQWQIINSPMELAKGELVRVDLFINTTTARHYVVIDDPVPGGLETVNRDLATSSLIDAGEESTQMSPNSWWHQYQDWSLYGSYGDSFYHKELRDDSARFFADYLPAGNYHLSYTAQAIAGGTFSIMPVKVEEMYEPDVYGLGLPATLDVEFEQD